MQRSNPSKVAGILILVGSCLALISSMFLYATLQIEYFVPYHGLRGIDLEFYVWTGIIIFEISAFALGLVSSLYTLKRKTFVIPLLGAGCLFVAGTLFFFKQFVRIFFPHIPGFNFYVLWNIYEGFFAFPLIFLSTLSLIFLFFSKKGIQVIKRSTLLQIAGALMIFCSVEAVFFGLISYSPYYRTALDDIGFLTPIYSWTLSICSAFFAMAAGITLLFKKHTPLSIGFISITLISGLLLAILFPFTIYILVLAPLWGLLFELPTIIFSAVALALALLGQRKYNQPTTKSVDTLVNATEPKNR